MTDLAVLTIEEVQAVHDAWVEQRIESGDSRVEPGEDGNLYHGADDDYWDMLEAVAEAKDMKESAAYVERLHPRDRLGQWSEKFGKKPGDLARLLQSSLGWDIEHLDMKELAEHATLCARPPASRFKLKSPCWVSPQLDFAVHRVLPAMIRRTHPDLALRLEETSPRWGWRQMGDLPLLREAVEWGVIGEWLATAPELG